MTCNTCVLSKRMIKLKLLFWVKFWNFKRNYLSWKSIFLFENDFFKKVRMNILHKLLSHTFRKALFRKNRFRINAPRNWYSFSRSRKIFYQNRGSNPGPGVFTNCIMHAYGSDVFKVWSIGVRNGENFMYQIRVLEEKK